MKFRIVWAIVLLCSAAVGGFVAGSRYERSRQPHIDSLALLHVNGKGAPVVGVWCTSAATATSAFIPMAGAEPDSTALPATEKPKSILGRPADD